MALMETKKSCHTCSVSVQAGWHKLLPCHYATDRPGWSGLLLCLCCLCVVLSISGCCNRGWPCLPGWYVLSPEKFTIKWCHESFNLGTYNCFFLNRLLWKRGHFSVQSCSSIKCITHCTEMQIRPNKWEWTDQEGMTILRRVWLMPPFNTLTYINTIHWYLYLFKC